MKSDTIHGGKADKAKPSDFDPKQLKMGIAVEMEHTKDRRLAREIAMDHLSEDPRYYTKLKKVHKEHASMRSDMHSFEELLEMMSSVNAWLNEGLMSRAGSFIKSKISKSKPSDGPVLKSRTGATPPPIPQKKLTPPVTARQTVSKETLSAVDRQIADRRRASKDVHSKFDLTTTESLLHALMQIRDVLGEAKMPTNSIKMRKPRKLILRPKPLVRPGSKLKSGTSAGSGF
jgi:hypothetical protein